jgi:hypothetical protein
MCQSPQTNGECLWCQFVDNGVNNLQVDNGVNNLQLRAKIRTIQPRRTEMPRLESEAPMACWLTHGWRRGVSNFPRVCSARCYLHALPKAPAAEKKKREREETRSDLFRKECGK